MRKNLFKLTIQELLLASLVGVILVAWQIDCGNRRRTLDKIAQAMTVSMFNSSHKESEYPVLSKLDQELVLKLRKLPNRDALLALASLPHREEVLELDENSDGLHRAWNSYEFDSVSSLSSYISSRFPPTRFNGSEQARLDNFIEEVLKQSEFSCQHNGR